MAVERMQVDALLYPCATAIEARPGDRLMVVAGVVVGVYTGRGPSVPAAPPAPAPKPAVAKEVARPAAPLPRQRHSSPPRERPRVIADQAAVWRDLLTALRANGGELHSSELRTKLPGYSQSSPAQFDFRQVVRDQTKAGALEVVAGPGTARRYILRNDPNGAPAVAEVAA